MKTKEIFKNFAIKCPGKEAQHELRYMIKKLAAEREQTVYELIKEIVQAQIKGETK